MLSPNQRGKQRAETNVDAAQLATQATTQDSRRRAGVNRQAQPQAQSHQLAASQAAAAKRTAEAMLTNEDERKAKRAEHRAAHAREVRARQAAERAAAAAAARAEAEAARVPDLHRLNEWLEEDGEDECDNDEWIAFEEYTIEQPQHGIYSLDELDDEDLEKDGFLSLFLSWCESDEYDQYKLDNEVSQMNYDEIDEQIDEPAPLTTPAEVRQQFGPRQPSPPPPDDDDPWGPYSADCYYESLEEREEQERREREAKRTTMAAAQVDVAQAAAAEGDESIDDGSSAPNAGKQRVGGIKPRRVSLPASEHASMPLNTLALRTHSTCPHSGHAHTLHTDKQMRRRRRVWQDQQTQQRGTTTTICTRTTSWMNITVCARGKPSSTQWQRTSYAHQRCRPLQGWSVTA